MAEERQENSFHGPQPPTYNTRLGDRLVVMENHHYPYIGTTWEPPAPPAGEPKELSLTKDTHTVQLGGGHERAAFVTRRTAKRYGL